MSAASLWFNSDDESLNHRGAADSEILAWESSLQPQCRSYAKRIHVVEFAGTGRYSDPQASGVDATPSELYRIDGD